MTKLPNKSQKARKRYIFTVAKVFPPSDHLGLDLLRLMAAYNDMGRITDWMKAHYNSIPTDPIAKEIAMGRISMQTRLMIGFLHEAFEVIKQMERLDEFSRFEKLLDEDGKGALEKIRVVKKESIPGVMEQIRDKATFHYLRPHFADAIKAFKKQFGEAVESSFFYLGSPPNVRAYYSLPDHLRDAIACGIKPREEIRTPLWKMMDIQRDLYIFLGSAFRAYMTDRGLANEFR